MAIALVYLVAVSAGAAAQTTDEPGAPTEGLVALQSEILLLVELDAFESVPPALAAVHREWVSYTNGFTRNGLLKWLYEVDRDGAAALDRLVDGDVRLSPAIRTALGVIPSTDRVSLESGSTIAIPTSAYVSALQSITTQLAGRVDVASLRPSSTAVAQDLVGPVGDSDQSVAPTRAAGASPRYPWAAVTLTLGAVLLVGIVLVLLGRRRVGSSPTVGHFDRLLDAGRRMAGALDRQEIAEIAVEEAIALTSARLGAFICVEEHRLSLGHQTGDVVDERRLDSGVLTRVAATGRTARLVSGDEPSITSLPAALLAVPVIGGGRVTGIVLLLKGDEAPFTERDEAAIGQLAPMVGSAMTAADMHSSVAELSRTDALTGLGNRRKLDNDLAAALMAVGDDRRIGLVMLDVDHFKRFNDTNGHAAGDEALASIGEVLAAHVRLGDAAYRYGGEEFALLLRNVSESQAVEVVERVRDAVADVRVDGAEPQPGGRLTISAGLVLVAGGDVDAAIGAADAALYEAKHLGRNRLVVATAGVGAG